ncbi:hypothetical protein CTAYLR_005092 [Chrysophaeum taylorii]|uniref:EF-hand domain-containing protein n=1 Tax=Chrysophaeum taylorii TaxID=2483200 RepID=A0AAD7XM41_9STRA|nr:hypothetical protein CTAYLR_005092 [Chrysophaeum taylorii]
MLEGIHHPTAAGDSCAPRLGRARVVLYQEMHFLTTLTGRAVAYAFFGSLMLANSNSWLGWLVGIYLFCIAAAMIFVGCRSTAKLEGLAAVSEHELGERFDAYDADHDGKLTRDQLVALCSDLGTILTPRELESALNLLDADDQGTVEKSAADSDKSTGVVGLVMLDLRLRGKIGRLGMCGTNGTKFPMIRQHMGRVIGDVYEGLDPSVIETFPADDVVDRKAYATALKSFGPGDVAIVFTPDDTHFEIAMACIERGLHVMITKPPVKTLAEHKALAAAARARADRIRGELGGFSFFQAYMSQPKHQLETFKAWAGKSSDISFYLNSHHVDFHEWACAGVARPERVTALKSTGVARARLEGVDSIEDTITLAVDWRNVKDGSTGHALYTSSWIAPKADVHSQQRFFYMGTNGEISVDQAHRGYTVTTDTKGYASSNPLFWKPAPSNGKFKGQATYGYVSFEAFVDAAAAINAKTTTLDEIDADFPSMQTTAGATAILEAGRRSLDANGLPFLITYQQDDQNDPKTFTPDDIKPLVELSL